MKVFRNANTMVSLDIYMAKIERAISDATKTAKFHTSIPTASDKVMREAISRLTTLGYETATNSDYFTIYWGGEEV